MMRTILVTIALALGGCATQPHWVEAGSQVQTDAVYGVGAARGIENPQLARITAENRARLEVVRLLQDHHDGKPALVAATLRNVSIRDVWTRNGTTYALAELTEVP